MTTSNNKLPPAPPPEVYNYVVKELSPLKKELFPFWQELVKLKVSYLEAIFQTKLNDMQNRFNNFAKRWIEAREKVTILEKLISPQDKEAENKILILMGSGYLAQMERNEAQLTRLMNDITNTMRDKKSEADFKRTLLISAFAVVISLVAIIISVSVE